MSKKTKKLAPIDIALIIGTSIILLIVISVFTVLSIIKNRNTNNIKTNDATTSQILQTTTEDSETEYTTEEETEIPTTSGEKETSFEISGGIEGDVVSKASIIRANFTTSEFWFVDTDFTAKYRIDLTKIIKDNIGGFAIVVEFNDSVNLLDYWNASVKKEGNKLIFTANNSVTFKLNTEKKAIIGFTVKSDYNAVPISYTIITNDVKEEISIDHRPPETTTESETTDDVTTTPEFESESTEDGTEDPETTIDETSTEESSTEESSTEESSSDESTLEESITDESTSEESTTLELFTDENSSEDITLNHSETSNLETENTTTNEI